MIARLHIGYYIVFFIRKGLPFLIPLGIYHYFNAPTWVIGCCAIIIILYHWYTWYTVEIPHRNKLYQTRIRELALREEKACILISRSFEQSELGKLSQVHYIPHVHSPVKSTLLKTILRDISKEYPVVLLGDKDFEYDDLLKNAYIIREIPEDTIDWMDIFCDISTHAATTLIIPGETEGFIRELETIKSSHTLTRSCVFMWPEYSHTNNKLLAQSAQQWNDLLLLLKEKGIHLPEHIPSGALLELNHQCEVIATYPLDSYKNISNALAAFVNPNIQGFPLYSMMGTLRQYELDSKDSLAIEIWNYLENQYRFS